MGRDRIADHGRRSAARVLAAMALCAVALGGHPSEARVPCVPGSIGPGGCDSIRPQDGPFDPSERVAIPEGEGLSEALAERVDALRGVPFAPDGRTRLLDPSGRRLRRATDPSGLVTRRQPRLLGRDPQSLQRYQIPYVVD